VFLTGIFPTIFAVTGIMIWLCKRSDRGPEMPDVPRRNYAPLSEPSVLVWLSQKDRTLNDPLSQVPRRSGSRSRCREPCSAGHRFCTNTSSLAIGCGANSGHNSTIDTRANQPGALCRAAGSILRDFT
jgi:hypothetical protein